MDRRPELHQKLKKLFDRDPHVYFQPPESTKLNYPCIVYKLTGYPEKTANNRPYFEHRQYQLTVIDKDPDSVLRERTAQLKFCRYIRPFVADDLNHFVFELYY